MTHFCRKCQLEKGGDAFYRDKKGRIFSPCRECISVRKSVNRRVNGDVLRERERARYSANIDKERERKRRYAATEKRKSQVRKWIERNPDFSARVQRAYRQKLKIAAMEALGGVCCRATGCGVNDPDVLEIDHILNDGKQERAKLSGTTLLRKIAANPDTTRYQVLCCNHNRKRCFAKEIDHGLQSYSSVAAS